MKSSFFRTPRCLSRHPSVLQASLEHRIILNTFLDYMCFEPTEFNFHGEVIILERGQYATTERDFADLCGLGITRHHVQRGWDYFEKAQILRHEVRQRKTIITLSNKESYEILFQEMRQDSRQTCAKLAPQTKNITNKEHVVVGKKGKEIVESCSMTKDDIYRESLVKNLDWSSNEIEEAWKICLKATHPITDRFAYVSGIINKKRELKKEKPWIKKKQNLPSPKPSEKDNTSFSEKDMKESPLAKFRHQSGHS